MLTIQKLIITLLILMWSVIFIRLFSKDVTSSIIILIMFTLAIYTVHKIHKL